VNETITVNSLKHELIKIVINTEGKQEEAVEEG